jgi:hypothetical protein
MAKPRDLANSVNSSSIPGSRLENDAITASKMAANSVDSSELANGSVSSGKIQDGAIITAKIASLAITADKLATGAVTPDKTTGGPAFRASVGTAFSVANDTMTKVTFGGETFDTANCFASNRFTPNVAGYYQVNACVQYDGTSLATSYAIIALYKNAALYTEGDIAALVQYGQLSICDIVYLNGTTDYIEIWMAQKQGTAQNMKGRYFSAAWIRP